MDDGEDLPDWDYESIYGADALETRKRARFRALEATVHALTDSYAVSADRAKVQAERSKRLLEPSHEEQHDDDHKHYT